MAGFVAFLFIGASAIVALAGKHVEAERKDLEARQAPAEAAVARIRAQGHNPTLNMTEFLKRSARMGRMVYGIP